VIKRCLILIVLASGICSQPFAAECDVTEPVAAENLFPQVKLETTAGDIVVELDRRRAPITANNFLRYVIATHYDDTIFHRVVGEFVVQGGGYNASDNSAIDSLGEIYNESGNGLRNELGTIAMARFNDPHTASSQFYFNLQDNQSLNPSSKRWGYTVFGRIVEGGEVVEQIGSMATGYSETFESSDVPLQTIVLKRASLLDP